MSSKCRTIVEFRKRYDSVVAAIDGTTWNQYWGKMSSRYEWIDYTFIQSTAWFLNHDILIVTTSSTEHDPYMRIQGNLLGENLNSYFPPLIMGCKTNSHYQSLLPCHPYRENIALETPFEKRINSLEKVKNPKPSYADKAKLHSPPFKKTVRANSNDKKHIQVGPEQNKENLRNGRQSKVFNYVYESKCLEFEILPNKRILCPICSTDFKNMHQHFLKSSCKVSNIEDFGESLNYSGWSTSKKI